MLDSGARKKMAGRGSVVVAWTAGPSVRVLQASLRGEDVVVTARGSAPAGEGDEGLARGVAAALQDAGIAERRVVICLPAQSMALKRVQLPPARPEQLRQMIEFEAQRHLPLPLEQLASGYFRLGEARPAGGAGEEILLGVIRRTDLVRLERALSGSGVLVEGYGVDALGLADDYLALSGASLNGAARLVLAGSGDSVHAQVFLGRSLLYTRTLSRDEPDWGSDLRRSLTAYSVEHPDAPIYDAVLVGDASEAEIERALGSPVRREPRGQDAATEGHEGLWAALEGVARQVLGRGQYPLSLSPQGGETRRGAGRGAALLAVAAVLALMAWLVMWRLDAQAARKRESEKAARVSRETARQEKVLAGLERQRALLVEQVSLLGAGAEPPLELLRRISVHAPDGVWLTGVTYQHGEPVQLLGTARTAAAATGFLRALEGETSFSRVDLGFLRSASIDDQPVTQFQITVHLADDPAAGSPVEDR